MKKLATLLAVLCLLPLDSYKSAEGDTLIRKEKSLLNFEKVFTGRYSGMLQRSRLVIRDADQWRLVWSEIEQNLQSSTSLPTVDFGRFMVILAAMGMQSTGGYEIEIVEVYREKEHIQLVVREISAGRGCLVTQELTSPVDIVMIARSDEPVAFLEHREIRDCD